MKFHHDFLNLEDNYSYEEGFGKNKGELNMKIIKAVLIVVLLLTSGCLKISSTPARTPAAKTTGAPAEATKIAANTTPENPTAAKTPEAGTTAKKQTVKFGSYKLEITSVVVDKSFPAGCTGEPPACTTAKPGKEIVSVTFVPVNLAEGKELPYKNIKGVKIANDKGKAYSKTLATYDAETNNLTLGFVVPDTSKSFKLKWPGNSTIGLKLSQ